MNEQIELLSANTTTIFYPRLLGLISEMLNTKFLNYDIPVNKLLGNFGTGGKTYQILRALLNELTNKKIFSALSLDNGNINVILTREGLNELNNLKPQKKFNYNAFYSIKNIYAAKLFWMLGCGYQRFSLSDIRLILCGTEQRHPMYADFKRFIINKALSELEKQQIDIEATYYKKGKKISYITFTSSKFKQRKHQQKTYIIGNEQLGFVKIGVAMDVEARLKQLQTSQPYKLSVLLLLDENIESWLHERFDSLRVNGEWFIYSNQMKEYINSIMAASSPLEQ